MQFAAVEEVPRGGRALLCSTERRFSSSDKVPLKMAVAGKEREVNCQINGGCSLSLCSAKHHIQYLHFSCAAATEKSSRKCSFSRYQATSGGRGRRRKSSHKHFQFPLPPPKGEGEGLQSKKYRDVWSDWPSASQLFLRLLNFEHPNICRTLYCSSVLKQQQKKTLVQIQ